LPSTAALPLQEWENFYVIIGSSAAALTGLMFVVVALSAERRRLSEGGGTSALDSFATPTIVHFCYALLVAALVSTPRQTPRTLGGCMLALGITGLGYGFVVLRRTRRQQAYKPVLEDWIWHTILPFVGYAALLATGILLPHAPEAALYAVAAAEMLLLFIGIHNAWDAAVWITSTTPADDWPSEAKPTTTPSAEAEAPAPPQTTTTRSDARTR
jgi:hypothetical protein